MNPHFFNLPKILVFSEEVDLRKSIDGLTSIVQASGLNPLDPDACYIFTNKHHNRVKVLAYDGTGQILLLKRLNEGTFKWRQLGEGIIALSASQVEYLLSGLPINSHREIQKTFPKYV